MAKIKELEKPINEPDQEYKFLDEGKKHLHTFRDKPLLGTSNVCGVIAKPLTWWAAGLAVEKLGWMNKGNAVKGWTKKEDRLARATEYQEMIGKLLPENYLELLDSAYSAHSTNLKDTAKSGTDMHALMEEYVKNCIENNSSIPMELISDDPRVQDFIAWSVANVQKFLWSEVHGYSETLWVGGISDCGVLLKDGKTGIIDFKSSKEAYDTHFIQCAGYDLLLSENGGFTSDGYPILTLEKPLNFYAVIPFGAEKFSVDFRFNVGELKEAFKSAVVIYKLLNNK